MTQQSAKQFCESCNGWDRSCEKCGGNGFINNRDQLTAAATELADYVANKNPGRYAPEIRESWTLKMVDWRVNAEYLARRYLELAGENK